MAKARSGGRYLAHGPRKYRRLACLAAIPFRCVEPLRDLGFGTQTVKVALLRKFQKPQGVPMAKRVADSCAAGLRQSSPICELFEWKIPRDCFMYIRADRSEFLKTLQAIGTL